MARAGSVKTAMDLYEFAATWQPARIELLQRRAKHVMDVFHADERKLQGLSAPKY